MAASFSSIFLPTPNRRFTGSSLMNAPTWSSRSSNCPFGFRQSDAILANSLFPAIPAEAVRPVSSSISLRISHATAAPDEAMALTSRYASSNESGSISSENLRKIPRTLADSDRYTSKRTGITTNSGQASSAFQVGIAERQPKVRAS